MAQTDTPEEASGATRPGRLIAVVGPSGVGKDSLLALARRELGAELCFVQRTITRPAAGDAEDHVPATDAEFAAREAAGGFCFCWRAHDLCYGLPASLRDHLAAGLPAVVNGSRKVLPQMAACFPGLAIVSITADPQVIAARLVARGREDAAQVAARLARSAPVPAVAPIRVVDNSGALEVAAADFVAALRDLARSGRVER
ncbi:phosphonate metabolism protein/1,5-bisphosphokinase (PRPP-forming) PhnN [Stappia stellulata]|uniref:phosphonate metabolism protein/1,5-bisphosphokinase (PRPP-forming) PhnN n=1 Tax=Stappia stellulata TaxID=71235 RepID=UPI0004196947|nr:phosphonate metabolism protein/1,5-bisphosphokinase (PRPP-forming) PhnN [Stappia stellulata]